MEDIEKFYKPKQDHLLPSKQTTKKSTISTNKNKEKVNLMVKLKNTVAMDLPQNYSACKKEEELSAYT